MEKIREGYTRVSEIVGQWNSYGSVPKYIMEEAALRGQYVHAAIKMHIDQGCTFPLDSEMDKYYQSYIRWREHTNLVSIQNERRYYSDNLMLTGEIDALVVTPESSCPMILDWKTSFKEVPENWILQGALYRMIAEENGLTNLSKNMLFIRLDKFGLFPDVHMYVYDDELELYCQASIMTFYARKKYSSK